MAKSLHELAVSLKDYIVEHEQPKHSSGSYTMQRLNNLKLDMGDNLDSEPSVAIMIAISQAKYSLKTGEKIEGSLGPEEKHINRWLHKSLVLEALNEIWLEKVASRGRVTNKERKVRSDSEGE